ncbi:MAG TPA: twin-arginine translocation signal domain-containing protein [Candidatus Rubrimentiphilum sp.]|nr:twin-arginine translocation signal domain-containing protein [Candidatus Rubrimentiphilum sp.]
MSKRVERREFLAACAAVCATASLGGIAYGQQTGFVPANIHLDASPSGRRMLAEFMGLSFEASLIPGGAFFNGSNRAMIDYVRGLGSRGILQFGGTNVDTTTYAPADLSNLAQFMDATGWRAILGLSLSAPVFGVADQAAKASQALGERLLAFELGSAPDLRFKDYGTFLSAFRTRVSSISANAPGATYAGPATATHTDWAARFAQDERPQLVMITQQYRHTVADAALRNGIRDLPKSTSLSDLPYRIEQIVSNSNNVANALWALDFGLELAASGADGANFHDDADSQRGPLYQALLLLKESVDARFVARVLQTTNSNFTAYAIERDDGTRVLTLINRDSNIGVTANVNAARPARNPRVRRLTGLSLDTTQANVVEWQTADPAALDVPPASAAVLTL